MKILGSCLSSIIIFALGISSAAAFKPTDSQDQTPVTLSQLDQHMRTYPRDVQAKFKRATLLAQLGRDAQAIDAFQVLIQRYPELPEPYNNLAALYAKRKQYEQARATLEAALRANPNYPLAYQNLGSLYLHLAAQAYQRAASLNTQDKFSVERQQQVQAILNPPLPIKSVNSETETTRKNND